MRRNSWHVAYAMSRRVHNKDVTVDKFLVFLLKLNHIGFLLVLRARTVGFGLPVGSLHGGSPYVLLFGFVDLDELFD